MPDAPPRPPAIIFLNRFYWPEEPATGQLLTDLATALAAAGQDVTVIASQPIQPGCAQQEIHAGVKVLRVRGTRWSRHGLAGKAVDFATFALGALWTLGRVARPRDRIVVLTDPPLLGVGAWLIARTRGARIFHWVQDIYPEVALALTGHRWLRLLRPIRNLAWRRADGCITLGQDMAATLAAAGVDPARITISPNWAPAGVGPSSPAAVDALRRQWGLAGQMVVAYSGNLGRVHDLEPVIAAAEALRDEPSIAFVFIGDGPQRAALEAAVRQRGLGQVRFFPPQPRAQLAVTLSLGDVHLVTLRPDCARLVFPSKLYGIVAVGRPVVVIGPPDGELARLVEDRGFGRAFDRGDLTGLAAMLRELGANRARRQQLAEAAARFHAGQPTPAQLAASWNKLLGSSPA